MRDEWSVDTRTPKQTNYEVYSTPITCALFFSRICEDFKLQKVLQSTYTNTNTETQPKTSGQDAEFILLYWARNNITEISF